MRHFITISIIFLLATFRCFGQASQRQIDSVNSVVDSLAHKKLSAVDSSLLKIDHAAEKINTLTNKPQQALDSVSNNINHFVASKANKVDSLQNKVFNIGNKENRQRGEVRDSINTLKNKYQTRLTNNRLTNSIDSLKNKTHGVDKYTSKVNSIEKINPTEKVQGVLTKEQTGAEGLMQKPLASVNENMSLFTKEAGGEGNLPSTVNLPNNSLSLPNLAGKTTDLSLPNTTVANTAIPNIPQGGLSQINIPSDNVTNKLKSDFINTGEIKEKITDQIPVTKINANAISNETKQITNYTAKVKNIEQSDLSNTKNVESKVVQQLPVKNEFAALEKENQLLKEQQDRLNSFKHPDEYRKQSLDKAKKLAVQKMVTYQNQIQESVGKVSKYQQRVGTVLNKFSKLPKRESLRKLRNYEHFVPGINWQVQRLNTIWMMDINPSLRYRITAYWSIGSGWSERIFYSRHAGNANAEQRIFGSRTFTEVVIYKGISARIDADYMNKVVVKDQNAGRRIWYWNYMAGIKKDFSYTPWLRGNVQFMYSIYEADNHQFMPGNYLVRFGLEYKKKYVKKK